MELSPSSLGSSRQKQGKINPTMPFLYLNPLIYIANGIGVKLPLAIPHLPHLPLVHVSLSCGVIQNITATIHKSRVLLFSTDTCNARGYPCTRPLPSKTQNTYSGQTGATPVALMCSVVASSDAGLFLTRQLQRPWV